MYSIRVESLAQSRPLEKCTVYPSPALYLCLGRRGRGYGSSRRGMVKRLQSNARLFGTKPAVFTDSNAGLFRENGARFAPSVGLLSCWKPPPLDWPVIILYVGTVAHASTVTIALPTFPSLAPFLLHTLPACPLHTQPPSPGLENSSCLRNTPFPPPSLASARAIHDQHGELDQPFPGG